MLLLHHTINLLHLVCLIFASKLGLNILGRPLNFGWAQFLHKLNLKIYHMPYFELISMKKQSINDNEIAF